MGRITLLAACCVLVIACFVYTSDAESVCRSRCNRLCRWNSRRNWRGRVGGWGNNGWGWGGNWHGNWYGRNRLACLQSCYNRQENCLNCPSPRTCTKCRDGFELNGNGRCVESPAEPTTCSWKGFACPNTGLVIPTSKLCDRNDDCGAFFDELDEDPTKCGDAPGHFYCNGTGGASPSFEYPTSSLCDCKVDCPTDASDEEAWNCSTCPVGWYDCGNGQCQANACPTPTTTPTPAP